MKTPPRLAGALVLLALGAASADARQDPGQATLPTELWGPHWRLETPQGPVHVWHPESYDPRTAGIVLYLHGYYTRIDATWREDNLAAQFEASGKNALFIAPEAPHSWDEAVEWTSLEPLLETVRSAIAAPLPQGPVVVVGHSGAFRTIVGWLRDPRIQDVILLDALYRNEGDFSWWLARSPGHATHRLVLVAIETLAKAERFARPFGRVPRRHTIPVEPAEFTPSERRARLLLFGSQYEHMELVTSGKVVPVLLELAPLSRVQRPTGSAAAGTR